MVVEERSGAALFEDGKVRLGWGAADAAVASDTQAAVPGASLNGRLRRWREVHEAERERRRWDGGVNGYAAAAASAGDASASLARVGALVELSELDEEQRALFAQRIAEHQARFSAYEKRERSEKVSKIQNVFPYLCEEECVEAMNLIAEERRELDDNVAVLGVEDEAITRLVDRGFELVVRQEVALRYMERAARAGELAAAAAMPAKWSATTGGAPRGRMRRGTARRAQGGKSNTELMMEGIRIGRRQDGRFCLDDAVRQVEQTGSFDGWSEARIKAWRNKEQNPNAYYYRFNDPGEEQRNGKWSRQEHDAFMRRLVECKIGDNYEWGIFSMALPGRVGYQCSNYYRTLLKRGAIKDDNYYFNQKGEPKFRFKTKDGEECSQTRAAPANGHGPLRRANGSQRSARGRHANRKRNAWSESDTDGDDDSDGELGYQPRKTAKAAPARRSGRTRTYVCYRELDAGDDEDAIPPCDASDAEASRGGCPSEPATQASSVHAGQDATIAVERSRGRLGDDAHATISAAAEGTQRHTQCNGGAGAAVTADGSNCESQPAGGVSARDADNPIPHFIDVITMAPVRRPSMSPAGHVLGYSTWRRVLQQAPKNTCPFTKAPLRLCDLVLLTHANIDQCRSRIIGLDDA